MFSQPKMTKLRNKLDSLTDSSVNLSEVSFQRALAPTLRQLAIENLRIGQGVIGKIFRRDNTEFVNSDKVKAAQTKYLEAQSNNGTWGTYVEAESLAEVLGCHLVVTNMKNGKEVNTRCLRRDANDGAPIIHLTCHDFVHWTYGGRSLGDGNCLFNSFALAIRDLKGIELSVNASQALDQQAALFSQYVKKAPTIQEIEDDMKKWENRWQSLTEKEKHKIEQQIESDYIYALKVASSKNPDELNSGDDIFLTVAQYPRPDEVEQEELEGQQVATKEIEDGYIEQLASVRRR